jgi:hypothetical protein
MFDKCVTSAADRRLNLCPLRSRSAPSDRAESPGGKNEAQS